MAVEFKIVLQDDPSSAPRSAGGGEVAPPPQDVADTRRRLQESASAATVGASEARAPYQQAANTLGKVGGMGDLAGAASAMGDLAAGANPVGAAITIAKVAAGRMASTIDDVRDKLQFFGDQTVRLAGNDYMGMFNATVDKAAESLEKIPIVGQVWAAELQLAIAPIRIFTDVVNAFIARGQQLAAYSGDLSQASAVSEIRSLRSDIREADVLGSGIASMIDGQSRISETLAEIMLPLKRFIVETLGRMMERIADIVERNGPMLEGIMELLTGMLQTMLDFAALDLEGAAKHIKETTERIAKAVERKNEKDNFEGGLRDQLFAGLGGHAPAQGAPDLRANRGDARRQLNTPIGLGLL